MKITLLGGASEIGASCSLLEVAGHNVLIDCGVRFNSPSPLPDLDKLSGKPLDAILVTHAHSDHTGALPIVHSKYPNVPIVMTPPTLELVKILQKDALKLMGMASEREGEIPLYQPKQVESMLQQVEPIQYLQSWNVGDLEFTYWPSSHIIGSAMIHAHTPEGNVLFSGDYCVTAQRTVPALERPPFTVDLLLTEATYGSRLHSDRKTAENLLVSNINQTVMNEGRVLIPCFAIGRAQEVLLIIKEAIQKKKLPEIPVFVDGMVRPVCDIYGKYQQYVSHAVLRAGREGHVFYNRYISPVSSPRDREKVLQNSPCIIVASSGMLSGGPSAFYASHLAPCEKDAILITGYQDEESPGSALLQLAQQTEDEPRELFLNGQPIEVKCRFDAYSLSAHADRMQICGLVSALHPQTTVLVHGDLEAKQSLKSVLPCQDVEIGWDGLAIDRKYKQRSKHRKVRLPDVTAENIQSLIADEPGPFPIEDLAQALFGYIPSKANLAGFAIEVEETELLKRDDKRRHLFKRVKQPSQSSQQIDAQAIKEENPKGKLNELCLKKRLSYPERFLVAKEDGLYHCSLRMTIDGKQWKTQQHSADSKILAEQLAAKEMVGLIEPVIEEIYADQQASVVSPAPGGDFSQEEINPKAKATLNNYWQTNLIKNFDCYEIRTEGEAHSPVFTMQAKAILPDDTVIQGESVQATKKKNAQMLAATKLLEKLQQHPAFQQQIADKQQQQTPFSQPTPKSKSSQPASIDEQTLRDLVTLLKAYDCKHNCRLPFRYLKKLAKETFRKDKTADQEWIEQRLAELHQKWQEEKTRWAKQHGHYPFIEFTPEIYEALQELYGSWVLEMMKNYLDDPTQAFPKWATQFAAAMNKIGLEKCQKHQDELYQFVTSHRAWEESIHAREDLDKLIASKKLEKVRKKFQ